MKQRYPLYFWFIAAIVLERMILYSKLLCSCCRMLWSFGGVDKMASIIHRNILITSIQNSAKIFFSWIFCKNWAYFLQIVLTRLNLFTLIMNKTIKTISSLSPMISPGWNAAKKPMVMHRKNYKINQLNFNFPLVFAACTKSAYKTRSIRM